MHRTTLNVLKAAKGLVDAWVSGKLKKLHYAQLEGAVDRWDEAHPEWETESEPKEERPSRYLTGVKDGEDGEGGEGGQP